MCLSPLLFSHQPSESVPSLEWKLPSSVSIVVLSRFFFPTQAYYIYLYTAKVAQKMGIIYVFRNVINKRWCMLNKQTFESWSDMTWLVLIFWEELDPKKKWNQWSLYLSHHQWHVSTCRCHPVQSKYANITSSPSWLALPSALSDSSSAILFRISCSKWTNRLWALRLPQTNTLR